MSNKANTGKKIVLFSDGTGNSSSSPAKTNVWRAYKALDVSPGSGQVAFYDGGVGTSSFSPLAVIGLVFGWGLAANVRQIYKFVCHSYKHHTYKKYRDEIYSLGFSRGAFTTRVLVAMIADQGIIDVSKVRGERDLDRLIVAAYRDFRRKNFDPSLLSKFLGRPLQAGWAWFWNSITCQRPYDPTRNFEHPKSKKPRDHSIRFVGVWDTVDAYGLPIDEMTRAWDKIVWPLSAKDRNLSKRVAKASHALALDEQRESFEPMLWNEKLPDSENGIDERITQVWFAGVHANVGGGYPDDSLSHVPLKWMLDQCEDNGLKFDPEECERLRQDTNLNGPIYDNRAGAGNFYRYAPRHIDQLCNSEKQGFWAWLKSWAVRNNKAIDAVTITKPKFHRSIFDRMEQSGGAYAPINIPKEYVVVEDNGKIIDICNPPKNSKPPEKPKEAVTRRTLQSSVWVNVFLGKVLYFTMLFIIMVFAAFPFIYGNGEKRTDGWLSNLIESIDFYVEPYLGTLSGVIREIPALIGKIPVPGMQFVSKWANEFGQDPYVFLIFVGVIIALLWQGRVVRARIHDEMRNGWAHFTGISHRSPAKPGAFRKRMAEFLEGEFYKKWIAAKIRHTVELATIMLFLMISVALLSRTTFIALDGFGVVCDEYKGTELFNPIGSDSDYDHDNSKPKNGFKLTVKLPGKDPCFATGFNLVKRERYHIRWEVPKDWSDSKIKSDVRGWTDSPPWYLYPATLLRRHLLARWYQPVARINNKLLDRYVLEHTGAKLPDWITKEMLEGKPARKVAPASDNGEKKKPAETELNRECTKKLHEDQPRRVLCTTILARRDGPLYLYVNDAVLFTPRFPIEFYLNNNGTASISVVHLP